MKKYTKIVNGSRIVKPRNKIVVVKGKRQIINPTEEILFADGWQEYIEPEPTYAELLAEVKERFVTEIYGYDSSSAVNAFFIGEEEVWLDKATRAGLKLRFEAEIAMGKTDTVLWYEGKQFSLTLSAAIQMLYAIEVYASACYDRTQYHIAQVKAMMTIEDIASYDFTTGYPEKLHF